MAYLFSDGGIETGIDIDRALDAARLISRLLGKPVNSNLLTAGGRLRPRNAASHRAARERPGGPSHG